AGGLSGRSESKGASLEVRPKPVDSAPAPTPQQEPLTWPERTTPAAQETPSPRKKPGPSSVIRRVNVDPAELPKALRDAPPPEVSKSAPGDSTVPAAHLLTPRPDTSPGAPPADPPTAPTRRDPASSRGKRPQSEGRRSASPKVVEAEKPRPPQAAPGSPSPRMHESRGIPASAISPTAPAKAPAAPLQKPPPEQRPDESSGTLAGFVNATRTLFKRFTSAPPEVRITLPQGDLKLFKLAGEIDDRLALQAATWLIFVQAMKSDADLTIAIDSTGGSITAGLTLIDVMLKAKCRVRTHCSRQALGISSIVLAAGTKGFRTVARTALLSIPGAPMSGDGKTTAVYAPRVVQAFAAATRLSTAQVERELLRLKTVTPKLAVKHGLADAVAV
ncbi:MAG: ATP-dependent Clp protease protease, partial [Planctomycetota bacterium]